MDARLSDAVFSAPAAPTLGGPGPLLPVPARPKPRTARVRVTSEVVGVRGALGGYYKSLPPYIDDITREYGPDTYERMQLDDQVSSSLRALCHGVLSDELVLRPGVDDKDDSDFTASKGALEFCERATWQQTGGLDQWLLTMLKGAVGGGNRVSETVYRPEESGKDAGRWVLGRLKVKPRRSVGFAVDSCNNLAGFLALLPGDTAVGWGGLAWGTAFDPQNPPDNFLPRDKFCALAWDPPDEDPRGSAILRCVYEPWWAKLQAAREWLAYLAQFGSPSLAATTAPGADNSAPADAWGNPAAGEVLTPEQDLANQLVAFRNGGVIVLPAGCTLDVIQSSNAGDAFLKKVDSCDRAIAQGILLAMRAVMQSRFGSRADAEQGQDVAGLQTRFMKRWLARMVTEDLLRPLVRINYGPDAARRLCPYASLSPVEHQDLGPALVAMTGAWKAGFLKPSQLPWAHEQFGMPPATPEELAPPAQPQALPGIQPPPAGGRPPPGGPPPAPGEPPAPPQAPFSQGGPDLSGLGDLLSLSRQEVLDALFDAAIDSFDMALPDAAFGADDPGGHWVTLEDGQHVFISGGEVQAARGQIGRAGGGPGGQELVDSGFAGKVDLSGATPAQAAAIVAGVKAGAAVAGKTLKLRSVEVVDRLPVGKDEGGLGYSAGRVYVTTGFLKNASSHGGDAKAKGRDFLKGTGAERNVSWEDADSPAEAIKMGVAHEMGHHASAALLLDVQKGVRDAKDAGADLSEAEVVKLSGYSSDHPEEMFAEAHSFVVTGREHKIPPGVREFYHRALATADPEPISDYVRGAADAPFYSPDQPRVPAGQPGGGRWAGGVSPGTTAARNAASDAVRAFARGQGPPTAREAHALAGHLAKLTLAQIHALKAQYGLKGSAPNKAALVAKLAQRFRDARAGAGSAAAPAPARVPAFVPGPQGPVPNPVLNRGANVITGVPAKAAVPMVPFAAERAWETGKPEPGVLNGIPFAPAPPKFWEKTRDVDVGEPPPARPVNRAGVLIREPDGRIWIVQPTNGFGNRKHTLPGGGVEPGLTDQQNALKEVWEETGLQVKITGYAGDFEDSNNGNNGRLYIGERVGGAPWDAKVESFIVSRKTGNPAAESETVTLVTPERAAQLLHRTDDLAQLMVAHPPPVDTPVRGKGSEALKKFVAAVGPAAREYERRRKAAGAYPGNAEMHVVQKMRGFNAKPKVVSKADFDALMAKGGHIEVLRGVKDHGYGASKVTGKQLADQYREGDHFPGHGIFGSGTYTDSTRGHGNVASGYAGRYSGGGGEVLRIALPRDAKIIKESELEKAVPQNPAAFAGYQATGGKLPRECWLGVQAALAGYDAIAVDGKSAYHGSYGDGFYVILNRSIATVQDKAPPPGYTIP
jgi:8-oxo-dGTP pyrophosphatase MutT (NUDIX family)